MYIIDICFPYVSSGEFAWIYIYIYMYIYARRIIFLWLGLYFGCPESPRAPYQASRGLQAPYRASRGPQGSISGLQRVPGLHIGPPELHRPSIMPQGSISSFQSGSILGFQTAPGLHIGLHFIEIEPGALELYGAESLLEEPHGG